MGLGFLPLEKLPLFVWALVLMGIGAFLAFHDDRFSWGQFRSISIFLIGFGVLIYDLKKRFFTKKVLDSKLDSDTEVKSD